MNQRKMGSEQLYAINQKMNVSKTCVNDNASGNATCCKTCQDSRRAHYDALWKHQTSQQHNTQTILPKNAQQTKLQRAILSTRIQKLEKHKQQHKYKTRMHNLKEPTTWQWKTVSCAPTWTTSQSTNKTKLNKYTSATAKPLALKCMNKYSLPTQNQWNTCQPNLRSSQHNKPLTHNK